MSYPANLTFKHQEKSSRLWAFLTIIPIKMFALFPHIIVLALVSIGAGFASLIGIFAVLFTGRYPKSFENLIVGFYRWQWRITAYLSCMSDKYPPFSLKSTDYPADLVFQHQEKSSRLWALLTLIGIKLVVLIPHVIVLMFMQIAMSVCMFIGIFAVLFIGRYPISFEKLIVATNKYTYRVNAYMFCLTDKYPPFPWKDETSVAPTTLNV